MTELAARRPEFHDHNLFLLGVLGLLSASGQVGTVLARDGGTTDQFGPIDLDDDPLLAAALGVVAIRERLLLHVAAAFTPPAGRTPASHANAAPGLRTLLR